MRAWSCAAGPAMSGCAANLSFSAGSSPGMQDREGSFRGRSRAISKWNGSATHRCGRRAKSPSSPMPIPLQFPHTSKETHRCIPIASHRWTPQRCSAGCSTTCRTNNCSASTGSFSLCRSRMIRSAWNVTARCWKPLSAWPPVRIRSLPRTSCPRGCAALGISNSRPCRCSTS